MFLIAGLGNPGKEYENTRHNAGFMVLDALADKLGADISEKKHKALCGKAVIGGQKVILLKPQTYMNSSGESIRAAADYYKVDPEDILVVYDDISLAPGQLRIRAKGSAGGHNGIKSIIAHLGTQEFPRVRVGVGEKPPRMDLADYVLGHFSQGERKIMEDAVKEAADAVMEAVEKNGRDICKSADGAGRIRRHEAGSYERKRTRPDLRRHRFPEGPCDVPGFGGEGLEVSCDSRRYQGQGALR